MIQETFSRARGSIIVGGIAAIILGILFLSQPLLAGVSICYFIGAMLAIAGVANIIFSIASKQEGGQSILLGVILLLFGIVCLARPDVIANLLTIMAGIYVIADGAMTFSDGIFCVRNKIGGGVLVVIMSVILIIAGFYMMFASFAFIMVLSGIALIADGVFSFVVAVALGKQIREAKDE